MQYSVAMQVSWQVAKSAARLATPPGALAFGNGVQTQDGSENEQNALQASNLTIVITLLQRVIDCMATVEQPS